MIPESNLLEAGHWAQLHRRCATAPAERLRAAGRLAAARPRAAEEEAAEPAGCSDSLLQRPRHFANGSRHRHLHRLPALLRPHCFPPRARSAPLPAVAMAAEGEAAAEPERLVADRQPGTPLRHRQMERIATKQR